MMSDAKPKRTARDAGRREIDPDDAVPKVVAPVVPAPVVPAPVVPAPAVVAPAVAAPVIDPPAPARPPAVAPPAVAQPSVTLPSVAPPSVALPEAAPEAAPLKPALIAEAMAEAVLPISEAAVEAAEEAAVVSVDDAWTALSDVQTALVRGFEQIAAEMSGMTRSGIAAASEAALALLAARTVSEAAEINAGLARRGVDAMIDGGARLSEIGVAALAEASRPMLWQFGGFAIAARR